MIEIQIGNNAADTRQGIKLPAEVLTSIKVLRGRLLDSAAMVRRETKTTLTAIASVEIHRYMRRL